MFTCATITLKDLQARSEIFVHGTEPLHRYVLAAQTNFYAHIERRLLGIARGENVTVLLQVVPASAQNCPVSGS
ncbi:MAG: hypothetical protein JWN41_1517 [Thermoleophilia bacterium]|nr:hypothetical protein [Thermoleophilia bacterium]